ncbi:MAG TPA: HNH endonuclease signature motif containing protein, partial [Steroidobacteraceae bacterium]
LAPGRVQPELEVSAASPAMPSSTTAALFAPLAPDRYSIRVTVSQSTHDKLRRATALLRHAVPDGDVADVLDRALDALIEKVHKRKNGKVDKPRKAKPSNDPRHVPSAVKREVVRRDGDRCAFVAPDGTRCSCTSWLEFDHVIPVARGGTSTVDNVRQLCQLCRARHNPHYAESEIMPRTLPPPDGGELVLRGIIRDFPGRPATSRAA